MARFPYSSVVQRPRRGGRRGVAIVLALIVLLVGGYVAAWQVGASFLREEVDRTVAEAQSLGLNVEADSLAVEGFPTEIGVMADRLHLRHFDGSQAVVPRLEAVARSWDLQTYRLRMPEGGSLALGPLLGGQSGWQEGSVGRADGAFREAVRPGGLPRLLDLTLQDIALTPRNGPTLTAASLTVVLEDDPRAESPQALSVAISDLRAPLDGPFGNAVETATVRLRPTPPLDLPVDEGTVTAWRDAGGALAVDRARLSMPGLEATAIGSLTLDAALQPSGTLRVTVADFDGLVDRLIDGGVLNAMTANLVRMAGRALSGLETAETDPAAEEAPPGSVTLPLTVEESTLRLGPIPVARLDRIDWPG